MQQPTMTTPDTISLHPYTKQQQLAMTMQQGGDPTCSPAGPMLNNNNQQYLEQWTLSVRNACSITMANNASKNKHSPCCLHTWQQQPMRIMHQRGDTASSPPPGHLIETAKKTSNTQHVLLCPCNRHQWLTRPATLPQTQPPLLPMKSQWQK